MTWGISQAKGLEIYAILKREMKHALKVHYNKLYRNMSSSQMLQLSIFCLCLGLHYKAINAVACRSTLPILIIHKEISA